MINKCYFTGYIGTELTLKTTATGKSCCKIPIAVTRPKQKQQEQAETDWIDLIAWGTTAEFCCKYLDKGDKVMVECQLRTSVVEDEKGNRRKYINFNIINIEATGRKKEHQEANTNDVTSDMFIDADDEELPF